MKFLFSPLGLIIILILVAIIFLPRRAPDAAKKLRKPMRAFPDEPDEPEKKPGTGGEASPKDGGADRRSGG